VPLAPPLAVVIEDDTQLSFIISVALGGAGYQVRTASDGRAGKALLEEAEPTLIVLDIDLPYISGIDLLRHIRATPRLARTWVLLNTADAIKSAYLTEIDDPYLFALLKPVAVEKMVQLARRLHPNTNAS
jgi:DNA-binding response OmpR family regulator